MDPRLNTMTRLLAFLGFALALGLAGCTDGRTATTPGELYHCVGDNDCLSGWTCQCGYCQQPGATQFTCGVDADVTGGDATISGDSDAGGGSDDVAAADTGSDASTDVAGTDATSGDTGNPPVGTPIGICNQAVSSDVVFKACNLTTWAGCDAGLGCYYGPALQQTLCKPHGAMAEGTTCDPCNLTECGETPDGHKLICDYVDKVCRRTCDATTPVKPGQCPTGEQCYQLVDGNNKPYPSSGGICAK